MIGVLMCYFMLQMVLQDGIKREEQQQSTKGEEGTSNRTIKSQPKRSA